MYKYLLVLAVAFTLNAQDGPKGPPTGEGRPLRHKLTDEQKKQRDSIVSKYDTNKDGKLDKEERVKVSGEDRKLLRSFGPPSGGPRGQKNDGPPPTKPKKA